MLYPDAMRLSRILLWGLLIIAADITDWEYVVRLQDEANLAGIERIAFGKPVQGNGP